MFRHLIGNEVLQFIAQRIGANLTENVPHTDKVRAAVSSDVFGKGGAAVHGPGHIVVELIDRDRLCIGRTQHGKQQVVIEALCVEVNLAAAADVEIVHAQLDLLLRSQSIFEYQVATQVTETNHIGPLLNGLPVRAQCCNGGKYLFDHADVD